MCGKMLGWKCSTEQVTFTDFIKSATLLRLNPQLQVAANAYFQVMSNISG